MKIIGKTPNGFICEISRDETANLLGFYGEYATKGKIDTLTPGDLIAVHAMYANLYTLAGLRQKLKKAQGELVECAKALEPVIPVIPEIVTPS